MILGPTAAALIAVFVVPAAAWWTWAHIELLTRIAAAIAIAGVVVLLLIPTYYSFRPASVVRDERSGARARGRPLVAWSALGLTFLSVSQGIASNVVASVVNKKVEARLPAVDEFYANHDLAALVGQSLRMLVLQQRERCAQTSDRLALERIAREVPSAWVRLVVDGATGDAVIGDSELLAFVADPHRPARDDGWWEARIRGWEQAAGTALSASTAAELARSLAAGFGVSLREALKHDYVTGGKAGVALQLDILGRLLRGSLESPVSEDAETRAALRDLAGAWTSLRAELAELRSASAEDSRATLEALAAVENRLALLTRDVLGRVDEMGRETSAIKADTTEIKERLDALPSRLSATRIESLSLHVRNPLGHQVEYPLVESNGIGRDAIPVALEEGSDIRLVGTFSADVAWELLLFDSDQTVVELSRSQGLEKRLDYPRDSGARLRGRGIQMFLALARTQAPAQPAHDPASGFLGLGPLPAALPEVWRCTLRGVDATGGRPLAVPGDFLMRVAERVPSECVVASAFFFEVR